MKAGKVFAFRRPAPTSVPKPTKRWGVLSNPVHVADTQAIARAKSIMSALGHIDLTASQARDVLRWHRQEA